MKERALALFVINTFAAACFDTSNAGTGAAARHSRPTPHDEAAEDAGASLPPDAGHDGGRVTDAGTGAPCFTDAGLPDCGFDGGGSWSAVESVLSRRCVSCHGPTPKLFGGFHLTADAAWENLVLARSNCDPQLMRVEPGKPASSLLWLKIADRGCGCGRFRAMPPAEDGLVATPEDFCAVENWIRAGAPQN
jgi:hypothetical protein